MGADDKTRANDASRMNGCLASLWDVELPIMGDLLPLLEGVGCFVLAASHMNFHWGWDTIVRNITIGQKCRPGVRVKLKRAMIRAELQ